MVSGKQSNKQCTHIIVLRVYLKYWLQKKLISTTTTCTNTNLFAVITSVSLANTWLKWHKFANQQETRAINRVRKCIRTKFETY